MELESLANWGEDFLKNHADKTAFAKLFGWWDELVGPQIAAISNPIYYKNEEATLLVEVSDHHWLRELRYHLPDIINKYQQKIHLAGLTKKIPEIKEIKLKYNSRLTKPDTQMAKFTNELQREFSSTVAPNRTDEVNTKNVDEELDRLLGIMGKYATGDTVHKTMTPLTSFESTNPISPEESTKPATHQTSLDPKVERTTETIDRYYPRNGFYSEFIFPPDELQNFDLY